jgi:hypothetical protein
MTKQRALATLTLPTSWELWKERNARVIKKKHASPLKFLANIKFEANISVIAELRDGVR